MAQVLRGAVYWADLNPVVGSEQAGLRPVLVISQDVFNLRSGVVIAMANSSQPQRADHSLTVEITDPGLPERSWIKTNQVRALPALRLRELITRLSPETVNEAVDGLGEVVGA